MTDERRPPREFAFPAGDDATDARWLAGLIQNLRRRVDGMTYPGVSAILDEAQQAAQAAAERAKRTERSGSRRPGARRHAEAAGRARITATGV